MTIQLQLQQMTDQMYAMPIKRLEALYNNCWRDLHNDINTMENETILSVMDIVIAERQYQVTGHGGSFELKPFDPDDTQEILPL